MRHDAEEASRISISSASATATADEQRRDQRDRREVQHHVGDDRGHRLAARQEFDGDRAHRRGRRREQQDQHAGVERPERPQDDDDADEADGDRRPAAQPHLLAQQQRREDVANSGAVKLSAVAVASGTMVMPTNQVIIEMKATKARSV